IAAHITRHLRANPIDAGVTMRAGSGYVISGGHSMQLISDTANPGGPDTPKYAPKATTSAAEQLIDPRSFLNGPPHDIFRQMRAEAPVAWCPPRNPGTGAGGLWALTRYDDVMAANGDAASFSSQRGGILITNAGPGQVQSQLGRA